MKLLDRAFTRYRDTVGLGMHTIHPSFLIIGAQKSGSTALHAFLRRHPSIFTPPDKELDFFSCDTRFAKGTSYYHNYFKFFGVKAGDISFEASPSYLKHEHSAARIHAYNPNLKIICTMRDPIDRAYSAFQMYRRKYEQDPHFFTDWYSNCFNESIEIEHRTPESLNSFELFIRQEIEAQEQNRVIDLDVLSHGMYYRKLKHYYQFFDPRNIMVIPSYELLYNSAATMRNVGEFIGVRSDEFGVEDGERVFTGSYKSAMTDIERNVLLEFYRPQNEALFNLIGKSFEWQS